MIFHIATRADWERARADGRYTTSTRGRTLADEGYVHAARSDQWQAIRERYYADVDEPLVLLMIDPERLSAPVVDEAAPGTDQTFPHVYGAIETAAVVRVTPLGRAEPSPHRRAFASLMFEEIRVRAGLGFVVILVSLVLCFVAKALFGDLAALVTILVALMAGFVLVTVLLRRRDRRLRAGAQR